MAAAPWWVISVSTLNNQPWQAITFQGSRSAAQSASRGGILSGPFSTEADAATWGKGWSARTHHQFTDNPNLSSANPVTDVPAGVAQVGNAAVNAVSGGWGSVPWLRIGEIALGLLLVAVGVAKMTNAIPIATRIARAVS